MMGKNVRMATVFHADEAVYNKFNLLAEQGADNIWQHTNFFGFLGLILGCFVVSYKNASNVIHSGTI
jgi:hypothetical protein